MKEKSREYYHIENTSVYESTVKKIVHRLAKLGGLMLNGCAEVHRLWINADGTESFHFLITPFESPADASTWAMLNPCSLQIFLIFS